MFINAQIARTERPMFDPAWHPAGAGP
jgi:hypothetical protein